VSLAEYLTTPHDPESPDAGIGVGFLLEDQGRALLRACGREMDWLAARAKEAVKARCPGLAPLDALAALAEERGIDRGPSEPAENWRARVSNAWDIWQWAGTAYGLLMALYWAGYPSVVLQSQAGKQYQLSQALTGDPLSDVLVNNTIGLHLGGSPEWWNQFAVFITRPWPSWWAGVAPPNGSLEQRTFGALIRRWKSAMSMCVSIQVIDGTPVGAALIVGSFTVGQGSAVTWSPPTE
jgi:hypothetical protein